MRTRERDRPPSFLCNVTGVEGERVLVSIYIPIMYLSTRVADTILFVAPPKVLTLFGNRPE